MSSDPEPASAPTFRQAESLAVTWLREAGYTDARPVGQDAPPGVDITATWALAQVRHGETAVRRAELQRLVEARGDRPDVALYSFASKSFDLPAVTYADAKGIALFSSTPTGAMLPRNTVASQLVGKPIAGRKVTTDGAAPAPPAILRWAPLLVAAYLAVLAGVLAVNLAQGAPGASVAYLALAVVGALAFFALWFFGTRRRPRSSPEKAPPRT